MHHTINLCLSANPIFQKRGYGNDLYSFFNGFFIVFGMEINDNEYDFVNMNSE